ncbi:monocarboxylate transporter [Pyrenophora seminiperda CCB06]|uniref:Monocarboxylate transporter n=1 Tax=Pyrenophora seminiperda CCB06 TaxID=1302712 RepID=A0A3M7MDP5_9PLEO|nr:monocarboxylate transporter [Pyrenophora seminiperda CCB06]
MALMGVVNTLALVVLPLKMPRMTKAERKEATTGIIGANVDILSSSLFVSTTLDLMEEAGRRKQALCVNKWGQFRMLNSGYAAISHVWAETMGLEFHDEKIEQDERGLLMLHFNKIMNKALQCGYKWIWLDLLAIPKKTAPGSSDIRLSQVKNVVINSLESVYRNADAVIVLDSFALNLPSVDPLRVAPALVCGLWLTRIWTYQEAKLAKKALIVTAAGVVSLADIVSALRQQAQVDKAKWDSLRKTFERLQPVHDIGIDLQDIALASTNRSTENNVDYARGFYALLGLQWQKEWNYEDGIQHIYRSRPQEVAMLASMHSLRGLAQPFSWAPRYLAKQQGHSVHSYFYNFNGSGLVGPWYTAVVRERVHVAFYGAAEAEEEEDHKLALQLRIDGMSGASVLATVVTWDFKWTPELIEWVELIPTGTARIICPIAMTSYEVESFPSVLLARQKPHASSAQAFGDVFASAILVGGDIEAPQVQWLLT